MPNVIGFKINGTTYEYDYDNLADIPTIDSTPTSGSTNAVQSGGVHDAIGAVEAQIPAVDATPTQNSTNAVQSGGVYSELTTVKEDLTLFQDYIPGETQTVTFENGKPHTITHTVNGTVVRTDTITYAPTSVTETRAIDGKTVIIRTNLMTLATEVEEQ